MKNSETSKSFSPNFSRWPINSPERFIHGCWQLNMMCFHAFSYECRNELRETYDLINHELGVSTVYLDLLCLEEKYRSKSKILDIIRDTEQPTWVWFINCEVLFDSSVAGWLRSILTTSDTGHVRVTFLLDNSKQYRDIFQSHSEPMFQSTIALALPTT